MAAFQAAEHLAMMEAHMRDARALRDHFASSHAPSAPPNECTICRNDTVASDLLLMPCATCHLCPTCLKRIVEEALSNPAKYPPRCCHLSVVHFSQNHAQSWADKGFLSRALLGRLQERMNELSVPGNLRLYCANPRCSSFLAPPKGQQQQQQQEQDQQQTRTCDDCNTVTCTSCRTRVDEDSPSHPHQCNPASLIPPLGNNPTNRIKACPACRVLVELQDGCNHITCANCRAEWCFICVSPYPCRYGCRQYHDPPRGYYDPATGYGRDGFHRDTGLDMEGYARDGFNPLGFDRTGARRQDDPWAASSTRRRLLPGYMGGYGVPDNMIYYHYYHDLAAILGHPPHNPPPHNPPPRNPPPYNVPAHGDHGLPPQEQFGDRPHLQGLPARLNGPAFRAVFAMGNQNLLAAGAGAGQGHGPGAQRAVNEPAPVHYGRRHARPGLANLHWRAPNRMDEGLPPMRAMHPENPEAELNAAAAAPRYNRPRRHNLGNGENGPVGNEFGDIVRFHNHMAQNAPERPQEVVHNQHLNLQALANEVQEEAMGPGNRFVPEVAPRVFQVPGRRMAELQRLRALQQQQQLRDLQLQQQPLLGDPANQYWDGAPMPQENAPPQAPVAEGIYGMPQAVPEAEQGQAANQGNRGPWRVNYLHRGRPVRGQPNQDGR